MHAPQVTTKLGVHLADNVEEYAVVVFSDCAVGYELGYDGRVAVDLVLDEGVEVLVVGMVGHNHQKDELRVLDLAL